MKATGIVRKVDELGRVVLPIELRRILDIKEGDPLEIFTDENGITLRPYLKRCPYCGRNHQELEENEIIKLNGEIVCMKCFNALKVKAERG